MHSRPDDFPARLVAVEQDVRRALVAAYGVDIGREAAAEAIAWAWQHKDRARDLDNLGGYLYRVGQTAARRLRARDVPVGSWPESNAVVPTIDFEPALQGALAELSERQRQIVLMIHGFGYTQTETAELLDCSVSTIRVHLSRAMDSLRSQLELPSEH